MILSALPLVLRPHPPFRWHWEEVRAAHGQLQHLGTLWSLNTLASPRGWSSPAHRCNALSVQTQSRPPWRGPASGSFVKSSSLSLEETGRVEYRAAVDFPTRRQRKRNTRDKQSQKACAWGQSAGYKAALPRRLGNWAPHPHAGASAPHLPVAQGHKCRLHTKVPKTSKDNKHLLCAY